MATTPVNVTRRNRRDTSYGVEKHSWDAMTVRKERDDTRKRRMTGWQVKYGWKSFSQKAVTIDGRKEWYCHQCSETQRLDQIDMSKVPGPRTGSATQRCRTYRTSHGKNEELNSLEEGMPRLKESESEKAARTEM